MSRIKYTAAKALSDHLAAAIPALAEAGAVAPIHEEADEVARFPGLVVIPGRMVFEPRTEDEVSEPSASETIVEIGHFAGAFELRVYAKHATEREKYEDLVIKEFGQREGCPGTLVRTISNIQVNEVVSTLSTQVRYRLDDETWDEEKVFSSKRYAFLSVLVELPCYVRRSGVYTIEQYVSAFTQDLTTDDPNLIPVEQIAVDENGNVTPYP